MNKSFNTVLTVLILATFIYAITLAYVLGFEGGVNFMFIIEQLNRQLHTDLLIDYRNWMHPMRNILFGTGIILVLCWESVLLSILLKRLSKSKQS